MPLRLLTALAALIVMYLARAVVLPIVAALVLKFVFTRPVRWLRKAGIPEPAGGAIVLVVFLTGCGVTIWYLSGPALEWLDKAPQVLARLDAYLAALRTPVERMASAADQARTAITGEAARQQPVTFTSLGWGGTLRPMAQGAATLTLLYLLLASGDLLLLKLIRVSPTLSHKKAALTVARQIEEAVSGYLGMLGLINLGFGTLVALALWAIGMPAAALWGLLAGLLNFVPYFGPLITAGVLTLVGAATFPDLRFAVAVPAIFWIATSIEGSVLRPYLLGGRLALNPIVTFMGLLLFGWMWGPAGLLLAVPLLAGLKIVADHVDSLSGLAEFLGR